MITISAGISKVSTMADGTLRLQFDCQEIGPEKMAQLFAQRNHVGFLTFKGEPFVEHEIDFLKNLKVDNLEGIKSKSQRLRAVMYKTWELDHKGFDTFEMYYASEMDRVINHYKSKLP